MAQFSELMFFSHELIGHTKHTKSFYKWLIAVEIQNANAQMYDF